MQSQQQTMQGLSIQEVEERRAHGICQQIAMGEHRSFRWPRCSTRVLEHGQVGGHDGIACAQYRTDCVVLMSDESDMAHHFSLL